MSARKDLSTCRMLIPATLITTHSLPSALSREEWAREAYIPASWRSVRHTWYLITRSGGARLNRWAAA